ncbi:NADH-quinone oxidoreductase subunit N [Chlamydiales bacterium STE3]|nr:NADH-quinone oxidoreductase subunit N [Chlamydiales bacterium STE3]
MSAFVRLTDFIAISPLLILLFGALLLLLVETFAEKWAKKGTFYLALILLTTAFYAALFAPESRDPLLTPWLRFDELARFFSLFFLGIGILVALLSASFFQRFEATRGEYYFLLLSALFGLILIGSSADFLTLFLGIETLSISLYVWCSYMKKWEISHEAALKYFLMGSMAAAFLLYGIALIYGALGTTRFDALLTGYQGLTTTYDRALFLGGISFVTLGLAFEAALVPFQVWAPDVYHGAPSPVTSFMAVGTKAGAFAAFIILFLFALPHFDLRWNYAMAALACFSLVYANFVALKQTQMRRFFAYSGISHAGFLVLPIIAGTADALLTVQFYLAIYALATLGAFAVFAFLDETSEGVKIEDLKGLFKKSPVLACSLAFFFLTLAGIPPTAGFLAKLAIFKLLYQAGYVWLVILALLTTILSAYYYLRILAVMFSSETHENSILQHSWPASLVGVISSLGILILSIYPTPFLALLK